VLVNSNPATIQTDHESADRVYIEPLTVEVLEKIIEKERPDGLFASVGGQTGLNLSVALHKRGILERYGVQFIGTDAEAIERAEGRECFNRTMRELGIPTLPGKTVSNFDDALAFAEEIGYPVIVRPSFTLGGTGSGVAKSERELRTICDLAFRLSAVGAALIEKSVLGWGEFEYEVVRDCAGNSAVICNMENLDPMGVHTGESIVVAPAQTLSDRDHQVLRNAALRIVSGIGVIGSCNVQFALNQATGEHVVIEVNPRLSRSSALASKATGYPIARIAAKLALGKLLHTVKNPITGTSAAFEPALDYVIVKIPRWPFDKFPNANRIIGTQMKSTGEVMAIGRTFEAALQKAIRSLEISSPRIENPEAHLEPPTDQRLFALFELFRRGKSVDELARRTGINKWFLEKIRALVAFERTIATAPLTYELLRKAKRLGFSDAQIAELRNTSEDSVRQLRKSLGIIPTYKMVDSCAGEFRALTPYYYSTYETENEAIRAEGPSILIIGSGPIRIGQGIEFDYCCCHAAFALRELAVRSIVINNNPETVSTDFDSSDRLYFEPLTAEDVLNVIENERPQGVIVQFGGQTAINLAQKLAEHGVPILGTQLDGIDIAEDRERFRNLLNELAIPQPKNGTATSEDSAVAIARQIGYPVVVRPSYVIAGRAMAIVYTDSELKQYIGEAVEVSERRPILIDKYLDSAIECEVDALCDGESVLIPGIMEHVEPAGVHSGDANIMLPSCHLDAKSTAAIIEYTKRIALALRTVGMINVQYAVRSGIVYALEANPRASRTVPFISKATGLALAKAATKILVGKRLSELGLHSRQNNCAVKSVVFPFLKLMGEDIRLGPEMRSTGESMGLGSSFEMAYHKALAGAGLSIALHKPAKCALLSLKDEDKIHAPALAALLRELGFAICGTAGTVKGIADATVVHKIGHGKPDVLDVINSGAVDIVVNTPTRGGKVNTDGFRIRRAAVERGIPCIVNINSAFELLHALIKLRSQPLEVRELRSYWKT